MLRVKGSAPMVGISPTCLPATSTAPPGPQTNYYANSTRFTTTTTGQPPPHSPAPPPLAGLALHPNHPPHQRWTRTNPTNPSSHTSNPTQNTRHPRQHQPLHAPNTRHTHEKKFVVEKSIYKRITPNYYQV